MIVGWLPKVGSVNKTCYNFKWKVVYKVGMLYVLTEDIILTLLYELTCMYNSVEKPYSNKKKTFFTLPATFLYKLLYIER